MNRAWVKLGLMVFFVCNLACAEDSIWGEWKSGGNSCDDHDVEVIRAGDTLAIIFDKLALSLSGARGGGSMQDLKTCNFQVQFTPPDGMFLAGFSQVYSGGMIKSAKSEAKLDIDYRLGPFNGHPKTLKWEKGRAINPGDASSSFVQVCADDD